MLISNYVQRVAEIGLHQHVQLCVPA
jgi:hypothetical protein